MRPSERASIIKARGTTWKCTICREMMTEEDMKTHKCNPVSDLIHNQDPHTSGLVELAYLRGKQCSS
jgi:hypothetical protein